jgi:hypothetical protein
MRGALCLPRAGVCYHKSVSKKLSILAAVAALCAAPLAARADTTVLDRTVPVARATVLQIQTGGGDVTLVPGDSKGTSVRVVAEQSGSAPMPHMTSSHPLNRLVVAITAAGTSMVPFAASASMRYTITYPARMRLDVRATSGSLQLANPAAGVEIYDANGSVSIAQPRAAVTVENAHGDIAVTNARAAIDLAADTGNVTASLAQGWTGSEVRMQSGTGDVRLAVPSNLRARIDATAGGTVHNAFGKSTARRPLVWLYAAAGNAWIAVL